MKLTNRIFEAIDMDGRDPKGARGHIRSKSILMPVLDRLQKNADGMLKSLDISSQKQLPVVDDTIKALKSFSMSVEGVSKIAKTTQGLSSLRSSGENKAVKALFHKIVKALKIIQINRKNKNVEATSRKQLDKFVSDAAKELEIIKKEVIKDL